MKITKRKFFSLAFLGGIAAAFGKVKIAPFKTDMRNPNNRRVYFTLENPGQLKSGICLRCYSTTDSEQAGEPEDFRFDRLITDGESGYDGVPINNKRLNKWWATKLGTNAPSQMICFDGVDRFPPEWKFFLMG